ncbi:radical SAM protein [uncultured Oscillibacter sp.]|uniref:radical SAM protein n=1 Tax=uncultured Oscillibacter sp. TaxID=876091 RepID=UPI00341F4372
MSVGSFGCDLRCPFCQGHEIPMAGEGKLETVELSPEALADKALELRATSERPTLTTSRWWAMSTSGTALSCSVSGGCSTSWSPTAPSKRPPWRELLPLIDAANIDLKGFTPEWYKRLGGDLETVKRFVTLAAGQCHVEVTTLLVPGEDDSVEGINALAQWLASVDRDIPLHLSRSFPRYRMMDRPPTPVERVYQLTDAAREYLTFVYTGNC